MKNEGTPGRSCRTVAAGIILFVAFFSAVPCCDGGTEEDPCPGAGEMHEGIWTDPATCLMWQEPQFVDRRDYVSAVESCASLTLGGYDDWRLPTINELRSLAVGCAATATDGACRVTDECATVSCSSAECAGCSEFGGPDEDGCYRVDELSADCMTTWSSTVVPDEPDTVWTVGYAGCHVYRFFKTQDNLNTRCVR